MIGRDASYTSSATAASNDALALSNLLPAASNLVTKVSSIAAEARNLVVEASIPLPPAISSTAVTFRRGGISTNRLPVDHPISLHGLSITVGRR